jgi:hypothetical protein
MGADPQKQPNYSQRIAVEHSHARDHEDKRYVWFRDHRGERRMRVMTVQEIRELLSEDQQNIFAMEGNTGTFTIVNSHLFNTRVLKNT